MFVIKIVNSRVERVYSQDAREKPAKATVILSSYFIIFVTENLTVTKCVRIDFG